MHKVVNNEYLTHLAAQLVEPFFSLVNIHAVFEIFHRFEHDDTLAERGAECVNGTDIPLGILGSKLFDGDA